MARRNPSGMRILQILLLALLVCGCGSRLATPGNAQKLTKGMSPAQVKSVLGKPNRDEAKTDHGQTGRGFYYSVDPEIMVLFMNDALITLWVGPKIVIGGPTAAPTP